MADDLARVLLELAVLTAIVSALALTANDEARLKARTVIAGTLSGPQHAGTMQIRPEFELALRRMSDRLFG